MTEYEAGYLQGLTDALSTARRVEWVQGRDRWSSAVSRLTTLLEDFIKKFEKK